MKIHLDTEKCQGHGRCYSLAPELFDCDDLGTADAYATAAFAMGPAAAEWTASLPGYEALVILADGLMVWTPGFPLADD